MEKLIEKIKNSINDTILVRGIKKKAVNLGYFYSIDKDQIKRLSDMVDNRQEEPLMKLSRRLGKELVIVYGDNFNLPTFLRKKVKEIDHNMERKYHPEKFPTYTVSVGPNEIEYGEMRSYRQGKKERIIDVHQIKTKVGNEIKKECHIYDTELKN